MSVAGWQGPKEMATSGRAVCSSQHPIVTQTMLDTLGAGGNAIDAAIAGAMVQATVQQDQTNHTGSVTALYWDAKTRQGFALNSMGTVVPDMPPMVPIPPGLGWARPGVPFAVIPGFMPGMKAMHERFATKPWAALCEPAIKWAEEGHTVGSQEHFGLSRANEFNLYTASGRAHYAANGFIPQAGQVWRKPELAKTLRRVAANGPDEFIEGDWARQFVARANTMGWPITLAHMGAIKARWQEPMSYQHNGTTVLQMPPPDRQAIFCSLVLGMLEEIGFTRMGHFSEAALPMYFMAHALRRATYETGFLHDPEMFESPKDIWLSKDYQRALGRILLQSLPKIDLTRHVEVLTGTMRMAQNTPSLIGTPSQSCELSIVDEQGNWLQLMNTLQGGGIPGEVIGGVPMVGSHGMTSLFGHYSAWFTGGGRMRSSFTHTFLMRDGAPWLGLGTPGNVHCTVPQVVSNILDYGMDPVHAIEMPRMLPYSSTTAYRVEPGEDAHVIAIEDRVPANVHGDLAKLGVFLKPLPTYDYQMGSFQVSWRNAEGQLNSIADVRQAGAAGGL